MSIEIFAAESELAKQIMMARHYHIVTEEFGPDPTLIAFIGLSEKVVKDDQGLESLDVLTDHVYLAENLLSEDALEEAAIEGLGEIFGKIGEWAKQNSDILTIGGIAVATVAGGIALGNIITKYTPDATHMSHAIDLYSKLVDIEIEACGRVPKDLTLAEWETFYATIGRQSEVWRSHVGELNHAISHLPQVKFENSDWTPTNFQEQCSIFVEHTNRLNESVHNTREHIQTLSHLSKIVKQNRERGKAINNLSVTNSMLKMDNDRLKRNAAVWGIQASPNRGPADVVMYISESIHHIDALIHASHSARQVIETWLARIAHNFKKA